MSWLDHLFDDAGHLGGITTRAGLTPKHWRPGRRSVELVRLKALRKASNTAIVDFLAKQRAALRKAGQTALTAPHAPGKPGQVAIRPAAPGRPGSVPVRRPPGIYTGALHGFLSGLVDHFGDGMGDPTIGPTQTPPGSSSGPVIDPVTGEPLPPGWTLDGNGNPVPPGDPPPPTNPNGTPYTGNAQVWVSQKAVQMFWDPRGAVRDKIAIDAQGNAPRVKPFQDPCLYPDGAPIIGQLWLPKINLETMNPTVFKPFVRATVVGGHIAWPKDDGVDYVYGDYQQSLYPDGGGNQLPGYRWKGTHNLDGNLYRQVMSGQARAPWGPIEPWGPMAQIESHKGGGDASVWYMQASFDWSGNDPTTSAYPFLYDWFFDDFLQWKVMPADLWLSTGVPISSLTQGVYLPYQPAPLLHNLDFLDSLATGNHGMPQVLNWSTGTLNFDALATWCAQDPKWQALGIIINQAKTQPFMVATIYDVTEVQVSPGTNATQPVPPLPAPPLDPSPPLVDPGYTGGIDPSLGPGYPGGGGGYVDWGGPPQYDPNAPQFVPNDGGGDYYDDGGDGGYAFPQLQQPQMQLPQNFIPFRGGPQPVGTPGELPPVMPPYLDQFDISDQPVDDYEAQSTVDDLEGDYY